MADTSGIQAALPQNSSSLSVMNPLDVMVKLQGLQNSQMQNKLYQQQLLNEQQSLENAKLTNRIGTQGLNTTMQSRARTIMFDLSNRADSDLAGGGLFKQALDDELLAGTIDQNTHDRSIQQIDRVTANGGDKNGALYRPMLNSAFASTMSPSEQVEFLRGKVKQTTLPGGQSQDVLVPGLGAGPGAQTTNVGTPYGGGISPEAGTDIVTLKAPDGTTRQFTKDQMNRLNLQGQGWTVVPQGSGTTIVPPGAVGGGAPLGAPGQPAAAPAAQPGTVAPVPSNAPPPVGGPNQAPAAKNTAGGPGDLLGKPIPSEGQVALANASRTKDMADLGQLTSRNWNDQQYNIQTVLKMANARDKNGNPIIDTGVGTEGKNLVAQMINNLNPSVAAFLGVDANKQDNMSDLYKSLARIALSNGQRSDADLFQSVASNPSGKMPPRALARAAGYLLALNNQDAVVTQEAHEKATHDPMDTDTHITPTRLRVQNGLDFNAFRAPYMEPDEQKAYLAGLSDKGQARHDHTMDLMEKWLPQPDAGMAPLAPPAPKAGGK